MDAKQRGYPQGVITTHLDMVFRSGMSRANDFRGASDAGVPIGVVAGEISGQQMVMSIPRYLSSGGAVFVDSGAFSAFLTGAEMDWQEIMRRYQRLLDCSMKPDRLFLVAPDRVGDQQETIRLTREWRESLLQIIRGGANLIIPIQCGGIPAQRMINQISGILGTDGWIAGIPSNRAAMTVEECATLIHSAFHILGRVQVDDEQALRIAALRKNNPNAMVTADANWMRSRIAKVSHAAAAEKAARNTQRTSATTDSCLRHPRAAAIKQLIAADDWGHLIA
jgi:hypothetical protein